MPNRFLPALAAILISISVSAQSDSLQINPITYFNYLSSGTLLAKKDKGITVSLSTLHGLRYNRLFAGIGVGYDVYDEWRIVPFFSAMGMEFPTGKNALLFQLHGGYSLIHNIPVNEFQPRYTSDGGTTFGGLFGYRIKKENVSLYFMAGYKFQRFQYDEVFPWSPTWSTSVKRDIQRVQLSMAFGMH
jgi:hypothetical protein